MILRSPMMKDLSSLFWMNHCMNLNCFRIRKKPRMGICLAYDPIHLELDDGYESGYDSESGDDLAFATN